MISNYFLHFANKLRFFKSEGGKLPVDTRDIKEVKLQAASPESKEHKVPAEVLAQQLELALKSPLSGLSGINTVDTGDGQTKIEKLSMLFGSMGEVAKRGEQFGKLIGGEISFKEYAKLGLNMSHHHLDASVAGGVRWLSSKFGLGRTTKNDFFMQHSHRVEAVPSGLADYIMSQLKQGMSMEQLVENIAKLHDWKSVGISADVVKLGENDKGAGTLEYLKMLMQTGATDGQGGDVLVNTDNVISGLTGENPKYRKILVDAFQATVTRAGQNAKGLVEAEIDGSISEVLVTDKNGDQKLLNVSQTRGWKWLAETGIRRFTMNPVLQQFMVGATTLGSGPAVVAAWLSSVAFAQEQYFQGQTDIGKVANDMALAGYTPKEIVEVLKARVQSTLSDLGENPNDSKLQSKIKAFNSFARKSLGFNFNSIDYSKAVTMGVNADAEMLITKLNDIDKAIESNKNLDVAKALNEALVDGVETDPSLQAKQAENIEVGFGKKAQLPPDIMAGIKQFANDQLPAFVKMSKKAGETKIGKAFNEKVGTKIVNWWGQATTKKFSEAAKVAIGEAFKNGEITAKERDEAFEKLRMQDIGGKAVMGISGLGLLDVVNRPDHAWGILVNFGTGLLTSAVFGAVAVGAKALDDSTGNRISGTAEYIGRTTGKAMGTTAGIVLETFGGAQEAVGGDKPAGTPESAKAMNLTQAIEKARNGQLKIGDEYENDKGQVVKILGDGTGKPGDVAGAATVAALTKMVEEQRSQAGNVASTQKPTPESATTVKEKGTTQPTPVPIVDTDVFTSDSMSISEIDVQQLRKEGYTLVESKGNDGSQFPLVLDGQGNPARDITTAYLLDPKTGEPVVRNGLRVPVLVSGAESSGSNLSAGGFVSKDFTSPSPEQLQQSKIQDNRPSSATSVEESSAKPTSETRPINPDIPVIQFTGNQKDLISKLAVGGVYQSPNGQLFSNYPGGRGLFEITQTFVESIPKQLEQLNQIASKPTTPEKSQQIQEAIGVRQTVWNNIEQKGGIQALFARSGQNNEVLNGKPAVEIKPSAVLGSLGVASPETNLSSTTRVSSADVAQAVTRTEVDRSVSPTKAKPMISNAVLNAFLNTDGATRQFVDDAAAVRGLYEGAKTISEGSYNQVRAIVYAVENNTEIPPKSKLADLPNGLDYDKFVAQLKVDPQLRKDILSAPTHSGIRFAANEQSSKVSGFISPFGGTIMFTASGKEDSEVWVAGASRMDIAGGLKLPQVDSSLPLIDNKPTKILDGNVLKIKYPAFVATQTGNQEVTINGVKITKPDLASSIINGTATLAQVQQEIFSIDPQNELVRDTYVPKSIDSPLTFDVKGKKVGLADIIATNAPLFFQTNDLANTPLKGKQAESGLALALLFGQTTSPAIKDQVVQSIRDANIHGKGYDTANLKNPTSQYFFEVRRILSQQAPEVLAKIDNGEPIFESDSKAVLSKFNLSSEGVTKQILSNQALVVNQKVLDDMSYEMADYGIYDPKQALNRFRNLGVEKNFDSMSAIGRSLPADSPLLALASRDPDLLKAELGILNSLLGLQEQTVDSTGVQKGLGIGGYTESSKMEFIGEIDRESISGLKNLLSNNPDMKKQVDYYANIMGIPLNIDVGGKLGNVVIASVLKQLLPAGFVINGKTETSTGSMNLTPEQTQAAITLFRQAGGILSKEELAKEFYAIRSKTGNAEEAFKQFFDKRSGTENGKYYFIMPDGSKEIFDTPEQRNAAYTIIRNSVVELQQTGMVQNNGGISGVTITDNAISIDGTKPTVKYSLPGADQLPAALRERVQKLGDNLAKTLESNLEKTQNITQLKANSGLEILTEEEFFAKYGSYIHGSSQFGTNYGGKGDDTTNAKPQFFTAYNGEKFAVDPELAKKLVAGEINTMPVIMMKCQNETEITSYRPASLTVGQELSVTPSTSIETEVGYYRKESKETHGSFWSKLPEPPKEKPPEEKPKAKPATPKENDPNTPANTRPGGENNPNNQVNSSGSPDETPITNPAGGPPGGTTPNDGITNGTPNTSVDPNLTPSNTAPTLDHPGGAVTSTPVTATDPTTTLPPNTFTPVVQPVDTAASTASASTDAATGALSGTAPAASELTNAATSTVVNTGGSAAAVNVLDGQMFDPSNPLLP